TIFLGEPLREARLVHVGSADKVVRHANVKRAADATGEKIDPIAALDAHSQSALRLSSRPSERAFSRASAEPGPSIPEASGLGIVLQRRCDITTAGVYWIPALRSRGQEPAPARPE